MLTSDQQRQRQACERSAEHFDASDFICREIRSRLSERLQFVTLEPLNILDLGTGTGLAVAELNARFPDARVIELDWSLAMLGQNSAPSRRVVCADAHQLPLADASIDIIFSNLLLPGCADPESIFAECRRVLRNPGLLLFSTLGPDTLKELGRAWRSVDSYVHVQPQADMHNVGDALVKAGFREPVLDVEMLTINYRDVAQLVTDLRAMAATNQSPQRPPGLTTPRRWEKFVSALGRDADERIPVSVEIVTGQAWSGPQDAGVQMDDGIAKFPLSRLRQYRG